MSGAIVATGYSSGNASDVGVRLTPRQYGLRSASRAVILLHGYNTVVGSGSAADFLPPSLPNLQTLTNALANAGYPCLAPNMDGNTWANDTAITRIGEAITYAQGTLGFHSGKVIILGVSMGGAAAYAYANAYLANVQAIVGILPLSDTNDFYTSRASAGQKTSVDAAYSGGWSQGTYGATHNPVTFASALAGLPIQAWSASDDTLVVPSTVAAFAAGVGSSVQTHNALTGGHSDAAIGQIPASSVLGFLATNA